MEYKGTYLMPPVFTAFNEDQTVNYEIIPQYVEYLTKAGITAVLGMFKKCISKN